MARYDAEGNKLIKGTYANSMGIKFVTYRFKMYSISSKSKLDMKKVRTYQTVYGRILDGNFLVVEEGKVGTYTRFMERISTRL